MGYKKKRHSYDEPAMSLNTAKSKATKTKSHMRRLMRLSPSVSPLRLARRALIWAAGSTCRACEESGERTCGASRMNSGKRS